MLFIIIILLYLNLPFLIVLLIIFKNQLFTNMTKEYILVYSLSNYFLALVFFVVLQVIIHKLSISNSKKHFFTIFTLNFFVLNEVVFILLLYDQLIIFDIFVPLGDCPWKHLRIAITILFIITVYGMYKQPNYLKHVLDYCIKK
jgi:hypothetical protein